MMIRWSRVVQAWSGQKHQENLIIYWVVRAVQAFLYIVVNVKKKEKEDKQYIYGWYFANAWTTRAIPLFTGFCGILAWTVPGPVPGPPH
jgi:hypothetical protein